MKLTGRKRYVSHKTWLSGEYLVLQVEVEGLLAENIGGWIECETKKWWRNATTEDLLTFEYESDINVAKD